MHSLSSREASPITQERLQRLSMYKSILTILMEELSHDLEHGGEVELGSLVVIHGEATGTPQIVCSQSAGRLMAMAGETSLAISRAANGSWPVGTNAALKLDARPVLTQSRDQLTSLCN